MIENLPQRQNDLQDRPASFLGWDESVLSFLGGARKADREAFLSLARELGRRLNQLAKFFASQGLAFPPREKEGETALTPENLKDLGAPSLPQFYALALPGLESPPLRLSPFEKTLPQGPDSLAQAAKALTRALSESGYGEDDFLGEGPSAKAPLSRQKLFLEQKAEIIRALRLWKKIKDITLAWPQELKVLWQKAAALEQGAEKILKKEQGRDLSLTENGPEIPGVSVTEAAAGLKERNQRALEHLYLHEKFQESLKAFSRRAENLAAVFLKAPQEPYDWEGLKNKLSEKLALLTRGHQELRERSARPRQDLSEALEKLTAAERRLSGRRLQESLEKAEELLDGAEAMSQSLLARRRLMARLYYYLPKKIGRPAHLEKMFLLEALALGRTENLLEGLRHRLSIFTGRLSGTHKLRRGAAGLLEKLNRPPREEAALLNEAHRRFFIFSQLADRDFGPEKVRGDAESRKSEESDPYLRQKLLNLDFEKRRLDEELAAAKESLSRQGLVKNRLLRALVRKKERLDLFQQKGRAIGEENQLLKGELSRLRRGRLRLVEIYEQSRLKLAEINRRLRENEEALSGNQETLARETSLRKKLLARLAQSKALLRGLAEEKRELEKKWREGTETLNERLALQKALEAELARQKEELAESSEARARLAETVNGQRLRLDRLTLVRQALVKSLKRRNLKETELAEEKRRLSALLGRQKNNVLRLAGLRHQLSAELGETRLRLGQLEEEKARLAEFLEDGRREQENLRLEKEKTAAELSELQGRLTGDLGPLFETMKQVIWDLEKGGREKESALAKARQREADLKITSSFAAAHHIRQWEEAAEAQEKISGELAQVQAENLALEKSNLSLGLALVCLSRQAEAKSASLSEAEKALAGQETLNAELLNLTKKQGLDLEKQKERLAGLLFLVEAFFQDSRFLNGERDKLAGEISAQRGVAELLRQENNHLNEELKKAGFKWEEAEKEKLGLAGRLEQLKPLVGFLADRFVDNVADLAQARLELSRLIGEKEKLLAHREALISEANGPVNILRERLFRLENELAEAQGQISALAAKEQELSESLAIQRSHNKETEILKTNLSARQSELVELRAQAFTLAQEKEELLTNLSEQEKERAALQEELSQSRDDLAENDGRLEASWAALTYLAAKSGDQLSGLKEKMAGQALKLDKLQIELAEKNRLVLKLTEDQNRLAVLYWTLMAKGLEKDGAPVSYDPALDFRPYVFPGAFEENGSRDDDIIELRERVAEEAENRESTKNQSPSETGSSEGRSFGQGLAGLGGKVVRRALFSLIMAGGLILGPKSEAAIENNRPAGAHDLKTLSSLTAPALGRQVDLSFLGLEERNKGENFILKAVSDQVRTRAGELGLDANSFLRLLKTAYPPQGRISFRDLDGPKAFHILAGPHYPHLTSLLDGRKDSPLNQEEKTGLLKAASFMETAESNFWDRLLKDLSQSRLSEEEALDAWLKRLARYAQPGGRTSARLEYAGLLSPIPELENMSPDLFGEFMGGFIGANWAEFTSLGGRARKREALKTALDIFSAARVFKMPKSYLALVLDGRREQWAPEEFTARPALFVKASAQKAKNVMSLSAIGWREEGPALCDLDEAYERTLGRKAEKGRQTKLLLINHFRANFAGRLKDGF